MPKLRRMLKLQRSGTPAGARTAPPAILHPATSNQHRGASRRGVTLIELLITMTIMAIIAAAILGTAAAAIEGAREKKTQSLITKIHTLLMERYASYETRRIDVAPSIVQAIDNWVSLAATPADIQARSVARGQMLADARLLGLRELMKKEMPDRWSDVQYVPLLLTKAPPLAETYYRRYQQIQSHPEVGTYQSAECLYMVIMMATGDGEARTLFSKQEIGDTDGDGAPEFLDGWGNPIRWLRWPSGVVSDLQPLNSTGGRPSDADHDPFDPYRRDAINILTPDIDLYPPTLKSVVQNNLRTRIQKATSASRTDLTAYRLVPFIYSHGPDGEATFKLPQPTDAPIDPYYETTDGFQAGDPDPAVLDTLKDNITNHLIEY